MFKNIGRKIKVLAVVLFWIGVSIAIVAGILTIISTVANSYSSSQEKIMGILSGFAILAGGFLSAWLSNFFLYGFGELIDSNQKILQILENNNKQ